MNDRTELLERAYDEGYQRGLAEASSAYEKRLRDEFALAILQSINARQQIMLDQRKKAAEICYGIADVMLEARKK